MSLDRNPINRSVNQIHYFKCLLSREDTTNYHSFLLNRIIIIYNYWLLLRNDYKSFIPEVTNQQNTT